MASWPGEAVLGGYSLRAWIGEGRVPARPFARIRSAVSSWKIFVCLIFSIALPQLVYAVGPSISSLLPTSGAVGASVTIAGSGFGSSRGSSTVTFNGTSVTTFPSWSASSISAVVPTGATTGNVVVTVSGRTSNGVLFTVVPPPVITSLSPTSGAVGTAVTISGNNFGTTQDSVSFNGTQATITSWSATSIVASVPNGATTGNVIVRASGVNSNGVNFTVWPNISGLSPSAGPVGTSVTITGFNFGATQGSSTVKFNGTVATVTTWSISSIGVTVPSGATTGSVIVTVSGNPSNGVNFIVGSVASITYHLHQEPGSYSGTDLLSTAAPDTASTFVQSSDLKGQGSPYWVTIKTFTSLSGVVGTIPASTTVSFAVWMKETVSVSGVFPNFDPWK